MPRYIVAAPEYGVEMAQDLDRRRPGRRVVLGIARAHLIVYERGDEGCERCPTVAQMLLQVDPVTGLLTIYGPTAHVKLRMDPAPLRDLPPDLRVSFGYMFAPHVEPAY